MGRNKKKNRRKKEKQRKQQNNPTEADPEKKDGAQARTESTTNSVGTDLVWSKSKSMGSSENPGITTSPAAGSSPNYQTPVASMTPPTPQSMDTEVMRSFRDIGLVVHAIDNNVRGLLIKVLAESICSRTQIINVIKILIRDHAQKDEQDDVSNDLKELEKFNDGTIPSDETLLLHMLKKAFGRFIQLTECKGLDKQVVTKLQTESQSLDEFCKKDKDKIFLFLRSSTVVAGHVIRVWIEEILHKAQITTRQFAYLLVCRQIHVNGLGNVVKRYWHLKDQVNALVEIRNRIVHMTFEFINDHGRNEFLELYEDFIRQIHLPKYFPLRDAKTELERYLQLKATAKDFENIVDRNCYSKLVAQYKDSECKRRQLEKTVSELTSLALTNQETISLRDNEIMKLTNPVTTQMFPENTQPYRMAAELTTRDR